MDEKKIEKIGRWLYSNMGSKNMKKLKEKVATLEKKVKTIENKYCGLVDFLSKHDKNELVQKHGQWNDHVTYLYNGELRSVELDSSYCGMNVIKNEKDSAILKLRYTYTETFWKLDKRKNIIIDITNEYQKYQKNEEADEKELEHE